MTTTFDRDILQLESTARGKVVVEDDPQGWSLDCADALEAARLRHAFRDYLESYGHPASDFDAAETVYGELIANCVEHAPGPLRVEFRWRDSALCVVDRCERLRDWPFSAAKPHLETTHHSFTIVNVLTGRVHVSRDARGGTRASVVLPVLPLLDLV